MKIKIIDKMGLIDCFVIYRERCGEESVNGSNILANNAVE